jgi:hypothetical protein
MSPPRNGIVLDMPFEEYLAVDALSATALRQLARSPWHYRNRVDIEPTRSMLRGTLAHCAVLEPDAMQARYAVVPEDAPRRPTAAQWNAKKSSPDSQAAKEWWAAFQESTAGRQIVSAEDYSLTQMQLAAVLANPVLADLLRDGVGEASLFWVDAETGIYCKARPDWVPPQHGGLIKPLDLKTCADESPSGFGRSAARLRYDLQDAHYRAGIEQVLGVKVEAFIFGAVTSKPPILAVPYMLTDEVRDQGRDERRELMGKLAHCRQHDEWPAYGAGIQLLDFPAYAKAGGEVEIEWSDEQ